MRHVALEITMAKISEAGKEILRKWQDLGIRFSNSYFKSTIFDFTDRAERYSIPEQPVPDGWTAAHLNTALTYGLKFSQRDGLTEIRIPAQPIPKDLLEMEEPKKEILVHHIPERKLWLAQREAGTNEQWKVKPRSWNDWKKIPIDEEPEWSEYYDYTTVNTVKYYFCLCRRKNGDIVSMSRTSKETLKHAVAVGDATIIGNIEERDVEV